MERSDFGDRGLLDHRMVWATAFRAATSVRW
jgi:hypothetical protein